MGVRGPYSGTPDVSGTSIEASILGWTTSGSVGQVTVDDGSGDIASGIWNRATQDRGDGVKGRSSRTGVDSLDSCAVLSL